MNWGSQLSSSRGRTLGHPLGSIIYVYRFISRQCRYLRVVQHLLIARWDLSGTPQEVLMKTNSTENGDRNYFLPQCQPTKSILQKPFLFPDDLFPFSLIHTLPNHQPPKVDLNYITPNSEVQLSKCYDLSIDPY